MNILEQCMVWRVLRLVRRSVRLICMIMASVITSLGMSQMGSADCSLSVYPLERCVQTV